MDLAAVTSVVAELDEVLVGRRFGKIFQLSKFSIAVDMRLPDSRFLFISIEPGNPRAYLIKRKLRDLEKASTEASPFSLFLRKRLSGAELTSVEQVPGERVMLLNFIGLDELGTAGEFSLLLQLTGISANLFLLDSQKTVLASARDTRGSGQQTGETYETPKRARASDAEVDGSTAGRAMPKGGSISEVLDAEDQARSEARNFQSLVDAARAKLKQETSKREKLVRELKKDLVRHGDAEKWKRFGDLLLANVATARRENDTVFVTDYFDERAPEVAVEVDNNDSLTEAAEKFFKKYTKARNAAIEIQRRVSVTTDELADLTSVREEIESAITNRDEERLREFVGARKAAADGRRVRQRDASPSGTRSFISSDGFEILVGKKAKDNDFLTFRVAKSLDTWMHAADYPGSHVVVRNPNRKDVPHTTLLEAAQLAAFYSQGKSQPKAAVHYTQKKFVNKPKGAAAGLVSLASFKTILVEPKITLRMVKADDE